MARVDSQGFRDGRNWALHYSSSCWACRIHERVSFSDGAGVADLGVAHLPRPLYRSSCSVCGRWLGQAPVVLELKECW